MLLRRRVLLPLAIFLVLLLVLLDIVNKYSARDLEYRLSRAFTYNPSDELPRYIWQTWKTSPLQEDYPPEFRPSSASWEILKPDFEHVIVTDYDAPLMIARLFANFKEVQRAFELLPKPVLKADFFRHLILLARGGIYSDIDTTALKPAADWIPSEMLPYGLAVGIEADPDRPDWRDWYARRIQFRQWTIVSKSGHPALINIVASITEDALRLNALDKLRPESMKTMMEFTGPGVWSDSLFNFFNEPSQSSNGSFETQNVTWQHFANLKQPMKERDVVVLPITSFSPGVGHMGSGSPSDPMAYVQHGFSGTWKHDERHV